MICVTHQILLCHTYCCHNCYQLLPNTDHLQQVEYIYITIVYNIFVLLPISNDQHAYLPSYLGLVWFMIFNATFNNITVISCRSVLLVEETRVPGENQRPVASH